jgi:hypothetical protein
MTSGNFPGTGGASRSAFPRIATLFGVAEAFAGSAGIPISYSVRSCFPSGMDAGYQISIVNGRA